MNTKPEAATPQTQNPGWGFWGTLEDYASDAWPLALRSVATATGQGSAQVRDFLDSGHGRHFADNVLNHLHGGAELAKAIEQATAQWMAWRITRECSKRYGIPRGLPYLVGMVAQFAA